MQNKSTPRKRPGRRRWSVITRYLTEVIQNPKAGQEKKFRAAMKLSDIYIAREQNEAAALRAEARRLEANAQESAPEPVEEPELSAEEAAQRFLASVRAKYGDQTNVE